MFIGRTDAGAETPILLPPDVKSWLIRKDSDAGRDWGQEEKGMTEDEMAVFNSVQPFLKGFQRVLRGLWETAAMKLKDTYSLESYDQPR